MDLGFLQSKLEEKIKALERMVSEMFSPPRVAPYAAEAGMQLGWPMDLQAIDPLAGCKWDLSDPKQQTR
eukprot:5828879-Lingulodinium_polyedra.AAC.1